MNVVIGENPPKHVARYLAHWVDRDGLTWVQVGRGTRASVNDEFGNAIWGGAEWEIFTPGGAYTDIIWRSDGDTNYSAVVSSVNQSWVSPSTNTGDYFTVFRLKRTIRLAALVIPLRAYTSGTIDVKVGIYQGFPSRVYGQHKLADPRLMFAKSGFTPTAKEPTLIPYSSATQDPLILRKGSRLFIRAVFGSDMDGNYMLSHIEDFAGGGSGSNHFRGDRERTSGIDYTAAIATLMSETFTTAAAIGSSAGSTSPARINWGMYGQVLD